MADPDTPDTATIERRNEPDGRRERAAAPITGRIGPYTLQHEVGAGAMGTVYLATRSSAGEADPPAFALKILHRDLTRDDRVVERFQREARVGRAVDHPNVVRTLEVGVHAGSNGALHYLVMPYVAGRTLRDLLRELSPVPEALCRHVGAEAARGLQAIHDAGVVHRDLKPENLLITEDEHVKVMDLGVARLMTEVVKLTQTGALVGSLHYAAPEQILGDGEEIDERADLHSLGVTLFELATGRYPFGEGEFGQVLRRILREEPPRAASFNPGISPFFDEVLATLLSKSRDERFPSASEVARVLERGEASDWWRDRARAIRAATGRSPRRARTRGEGPFEGRKRELLELRSLFDDAAAGRGRSVVIEGDAGIGKSRLVDAFLSGLEGSETDLNILSGSYAAVGGSAAPRGLAAAIRERLGDGEEALAPYMGATGDCTTRFASIVRGEGVIAGTEPLTPSQLEGAYVAVVQALAAERPTVVFLDDLDLASETSLERFASLARAIRASTVLLVGAGEAGRSTDWLRAAGRLPDAVWLELGPLGEESVQGFLRAGIEGSPLSSEVAARVARHVGGNPLLAREAVRELRLGRDITGEITDALTTSGAASSSHSVVVDLSKGRIDRLTPDERHLLTVAACVGFRFDPLLVGESIGLGRLAVLEALARVESVHQVVRSVGGEFAFDHRQLHDSVLGTAPALVRRECHAAIAACIERRAGRGDSHEISGRTALQVCTHYLAAGAVRRARRHLLPSLDHLAANHQHAAALELADKALSARGLLSGRARLQVLFRKVGGLHLLGLKEGQWTALEEASELADTLGDPLLRARVLRNRGAHLLGAARHADARRALSRAIDLAHSIGDVREEALAMATLGDVLGALGRHHQAVSRYERSLELAREAMDLKAEARVVSALGRMADALGWYSKALAHINRGLALARGVGEAVAEAEGLLDLADTLTDLGDRTEATKHIERAERLADEGGYKGLSARCGLARARVAEQRGQLEAAARLYEAGMRAGDDFPSRVCVAAALVGLGRVRAAQGRHEEAREPLGVGLDLAKALDASSEAAVAAAVLALLPGGSADVALEMFEEREFRLPVRDKIHVRRLLYGKTNDIIHLSEARHLVLHLKAHAPEDYAARMLEAVPLYRDVLAAWAAQDV